VNGARRRVSRLPLRVRLVAGFSVAMMLLLTAASAFVYWRVQYALDRGLDTDLESATGVIEPVVGADGAVTSPDTANATGTGWQVLDRTGEVLDSGGPAPRTSLISESRLGQVGRSGFRTFDVGSFLPIGGEPYRVRVTSLPGASGQAAYLLVGVRRDHRDEALRELLLQLTLAGLAALVIASLVGDVLARLALRPVERYRRRAAEISAGASGLRLDVPPARDDEVTRLGHTLNEMLGALEESLDRERHFVNDASHELRTPLTLLKSRIQLTRRRPRTVEEHEKALDELAVDVTRLADLAEQLLALSQRPPEANASADVSTAAEAVVNSWVTAHPDRVRDIRLLAPHERVAAAIEMHSLERIVTNLINNAFTHGRPPITVRVRRDVGYAALEVTDSGEGMPPDLLVQATHRFSRAVEARSRPGAGLGLSIVEQLVTDAGGELRLCHGGHHVSSGTPTEVRCRHDDNMTISVILPAATAG
jgi:two-component system OmpR family sensor kinase